MCLLSLSALSHSASHMPVLHTCFVLARDCSGQECAHFHTNFYSRPHHGFVIVAAMHVMAEIIVVAVMLVGPCAQRLLARGSGYKYCTSPDVADMHVRVVTVQKYCLCLLKKKSSSIRARNWKEHIRKWKEHVRKVYMSHALWACMQGEQSHAHNHLFLWGQDCANL